MQVCSFAHWSVVISRHDTARRLFGLAVFIIVVALGEYAELRRPEWGVDEGQRIAEAYFLRLAQKGDFSNPDWVLHVTDSSHPPLNKFFFGLALLVHGVGLPPDLSLPRYYEQGGLAAGWAPPVDLEASYRPMLLPARRAALWCNAASVAAVCTLLAGWFGVGWAIVALLLFLRHYLFLTLWGLARSDALQTLTLTLTAIPLWGLWDSGQFRGKGNALRAVLIGLFAALAFQTRVNGLLALGGAAAVLLVAIAQVRWSWRAVALLLTACLTCFLVATVVNPYYWSQPRPDPRLPSDYTTSKPLPSRIVDRYWFQVRDLNSLLDQQADSSRLRTLKQRARFVASVLFSGKAGLLIAIGWILAALALIKASPKHRSVIVFSIIWTITIVAVFTVWIPLNWEAYVLLLLPSSILLATCGWATTIAEGVTAVRARGASSFRGRWERLGCKL